MTEENYEESGVEEAGNTPSINFAITHHPITGERLIVLMVRDSSGSSVQLSLQAMDALALASQLNAQAQWLVTVQNEQAYAQQQQAKAGLNGSGLIVP